MPMQRRLPKRGFKNAFRVSYYPVNVGELDRLGLDSIDPEVLVKAGLMPRKAKLLKVLEEKRFRRLGDVSERQVDVRLIAAAHQDLGLLAQQDKFRSDLYYRISTIPLVMPSLRERVEDIPILAQYFLNALAIDLSRREPSSVEEV